MAPSRSQPGRCKSVGAPVYRTVGFTTSAYPSHARLMADDVYEMAAKRSTAKSEARHGLTRAEACKALQVAPTADEELIMQAYWHQARKVRALASRDPEARAQLDELNRAYLVLNPARTDAPLADEAPPHRDGSPRLGEEVIASLRKIVDVTRSRWPQHIREVTTLMVTTAILTYLALSAGADPPWTMLVAAVAAVTIWSPWRRI